MSLLLQKCAAPDGRAMELKSPTLGQDNQLAISSWRRIQSTGYVRRRTGHVTTENANLALWRFHGGAFDELIYGNVWRQIGHSTEHAEE